MRAGRRVKTWTCINVPYDLIIVKDNVILLDERLIARLGLWLLIQQVSLHQGRSNTLLPLLSCQAIVVQRQWAAWTSLSQRRSLEDQSLNKSPVNPRRVCTYLSAIIVCVFLFGFAPLESCMGMDFRCGFSATLRIACEKHKGLWALTDLAWFVATSLYLV